MSALGKVSFGDLFTLANGVLGFVAIAYVVAGSYLYATGLLLISMVMDGLDGYSARRFGSKHSRGQVLDSISDSISFAFAPALLIYAELRDPLVASPTGSLENFAILVCAAAFMAAGLFRLARFSVGGYQLKYFTGLPAPAAALFILLVCMLFGTTDGSEPSGLYFATGEVPAVVILCAVAACMLMASQIPYPKVTGWMAKASAVGIAAAIMPYIAGLAIVDDQQLYTAFSRTATGIALALTICYIVGGPLYERRKGAES